MNYHPAIPLSPCHSSWMGSNVPFHLDGPGFASLVVFALASNQMRPETFLVRRQFNTARVELFWN